MKSVAGCPHTAIGGSWINAPLFCSECVTGSEKSFCNPELSQFAESLGRKQNVAAQSE